MDNVDNQYVIVEANRMGADRNRMDAANYRTDAEGGSIIIAHINVNNLINTDPHGYFNGQFIPVFQDALCALACNLDVKPGTLRVLLYLLSIVDENNSICATANDISNDIKCSSDTVNRALQQLISMRILCKKGNDSRSTKYELSDKIINPRLAYKGNTKKLNKKALPPLLAPTGIDLVPSSEIVMNYDF